MRNETRRHEETNFGRRVTEAQSTHRGDNGANEGNLWTFSRSGRRTEFHHQGTEGTKRHQEVFGDWADCGFEWVFELVDWGFGFSWVT